MILATYSLPGCPNVFASGNVTVNETPIVSVNDVTICSGESATLTANPSLLGGIYSWSPNGQTTQDILVNPIVNSTYSVIYTLNGCPSNSISSNVTVIQNPTINVSVSQNILTADQAGATYQWLDCLNSNDPISGENGQTYLALMNGEYAVEISLNGCMDTSDCYVVNTNDMIETDFISGIKLYPNPFNDLLNIVSDERLIGSKLILFKQATSPRLGSWTGFAASARGA